jgi:hypothetical protein
MNNEDNFYLYQQQLLNGPQSLATDRLAVSDDDIVEWSPAT